MVGVGGWAPGPAALAALSPEIRSAYLAAIVAALRVVFEGAAAVAALAFLLTLGLLSGCDAGKQVLKPRIARARIGADEDIGRLEILDGTQAVL